jgi:hypothetical protein
MKNYILLLLSGFILTNDQYPTQAQLDEMLHQTMQVIWEEAMKAKSAVRQITPQVREDLLDNLSSSAPTVNFITHADLSDDLTSANNTSASVFVSTDNQQSWMQNSAVAPVDQVGYETTWGATTITDGGNDVFWYLQGSVDSGSLGFDFGQMTVSQSPYNSGNIWPPSSNLYTTIITDSANDTGPGQDIVNLKATYSDDKLYTSIGLGGSCCDEGGFFGPWNLYATAILNPDAEASVAYAYAYGDGGFLAGDQLYPGIYKLDGDLATEQITGFENITTDFDYSTAGNNFQASSLLSYILDDADWGVWPNSLNGIVLLGTVVQADASVTISILDTTDPGVLVMSTQSQATNVAPILTDVVYANGVLSVVYTDDDDNLAASHELFIDDMAFIMTPDSHTYSEGVTFSADIGVGAGNVEFFFSDGAATVTLQEDLGGGNSCQLAGDANGDGTVNVIDIVLTTNLILCSDCPDNYNACSDVNGDMLINVLDIVAIVNQILGL